jgi:hypothetical protein
MRDSLDGAPAISLTSTRSHWRRWAFPGIYAAVIALSVVLRGDDPLVFAVWRATLPWAIIAYGPMSEALGWTIIVVGALLNGAIAWYIGFHLDARRDG